MSDCPACGHPPIATWKRAFLSPIAPFPCEHCDAELGVSWPSYLLAISVGSTLFVLAYFLFDENSTKQYLGFATGFVLMLLGQTFFMPLCQKDKPSN